MLCTSNASAIKHAIAAAIRKLLSLVFFFMDIIKRSLGFNHALIDGVAVLSKCQSSLKCDKTLIIF